MGHIEYINAYKIWEIYSTQDSDCKKKVEQNSLDCSASAMVLLRAEYVGAIVLQMLLWTPDSSFNIDLKLINHGTKKVYFFLDNW